MPPKRRGRVRGKGKQKSCKSKESSSEEMERCTAEDIVTRLAKKYLLKSSTDTEHSDQKENNRLAQRVVDPYDADLETSEVDTAASVDTASDMECLDAQGITQVLSPSRRVNASTTSSNKGKALKSNTGALNPSHGTTKERLSKPEMTTRLRRTSRKSSTSTTPQYASKGSSDDTAKDEPSLRSDSGMFVSPFTNVHRRFLPKMNASDTSTPTSMVGDVRSDLNDSCFGFDSLVTPDPLAPISPVDHVLPPNHQPISRSSLGDVSVAADNSKLDSYTVSPPVKRKVSASLDLTSLVSDQQPAKRLRRKKQDPAVAIAEKDWAMKMAEQFEDIEMHELTIEG
ncbi:uncharacterized protein [Asterias amurensis]|uniref:uncharacterized protein n=1 Tax=Asterias amurensis TaxID=7602 RepID=UPI003AB12541